MEILETNGNCPYCNKKIFSYAPQQKLYGSPIRRCKYCNADYLDRRYSEIAVSGIPAIELSRRKGLMGAALGAIMFIIGFGKYTIEIEYFGYYYTYDIAIIILSAVLILISLIDVIRVITGSKAREFEKYKAESEERLSDKSYAKFLSDIGYDVPEEYLSEGQQ